jgi:hypothetical protein
MPVDRAQIIEFFSAALPTSLETIWIAYDTCKGDNKFKHHVMCDVPYIQTGSGLPSMFLPGFSGPSRRSSHIPSRNDGAPLTRVQ